MEDNENKTTISPTAGEDNGKNAGDVVFTQDQVNALIQKRLAEEKSKNEKLLTETLASKLAEQERLSKLTQEEKERELLNQSKMQIEAKQRELNIKENKIFAYEKFTELGIPTSLIDMVIHEDKEIMESNIQKLQTDFKKAVESEIKNALKGTTNTDVNSNKDIVKKNSKNYF